MFCCNYGAPNSLNIGDRQNPNNDHSASNHRFINIYYDVLE